MQAHQVLEHKMAEWLGCSPDNVVACSSGTAALHLALESSGLPRGSNVLVPDYTMVACARAVTLAGHTPVFVDCDRDLLIAPLRAHRLASHAQALMAVHIYGRRCNMDALAALDAHGMYIVEDMAELHGTKPHPHTDAACWSFYRNKVVHGEEGGAVYFRDAHKAVLARQLRCLGFTADHDFVHKPRGHNYRLADLLATPIIDSLSHMGANLRHRKFVESWYDARIPRPWHMPPRESVWVYDVNVPGMTLPMQHSVVRELNEAGIQARCGFRPMTEQPEYFNRQNTMAFRLSRSVFYLPVTETMTEAEVDLACRTLLTVLPPS
jgi:perosamine synthetase